MIYNFFKKGSSHEEAKISFIKAHTSYNYSKSVLYNINVHILI